MLSYDPDEDWSPASWLGAYASVLWNEYLTYWELQNVPEESRFTTEERQHFRHLKEVADAVIPCMHSLAVDEVVTDKVRHMLGSLGATIAVDTELAAKMVRAMQSHPIVRDGIRIDLAIQAADRLLVGAEARAPVLIALVATRTLSPRAAAYLDRATRLYLWGFEPETVVMCGAVLEAACESRFSDADMENLRLVKKSQAWTAHEYERAAELTGLYLKEHKEMAGRVRRARNDTIHNAPNTTLAAIEAMRTTAVLLERLFPHGDIE